MRPSRTALGRLLAGGALLAAVTSLPWLSGTDPALTVLRARSGDQDPTPGQLAAVRRQLGLDEGPFAHLVRWLGGDAGTSWVSGEAVWPQVSDAFAVSATMMLGALAVTVLVAALVCGPALYRGRASGGVTAAALAALPKFLLASLLALVGGVWLGWFPSSGWEGPSSMALPALALGVPSGAMIGGLLQQALPGALREPWARTARAFGMPRRYVVRNALRRALPGVLPGLLPTVVGLVGGSVAVEKIFNIPGLGRLALDTALAQDLPPLQTVTLVLVLLGVGAGLAIRGMCRVLLGPALRDGALPALPVVEVRPLRGLAVGCAAVLTAVVVAGLSRDPSQVDTAARLLAPSLQHPLGTDSLGRDMLARLGHGAVRTASVAGVVTVVSVLVGLVLGV
ncbi:MAG TPA: ABC transporter permease subunit, partial [Streptomyces sp.]